MSYKTPSIWKFATQYASKLLSNAFHSDRHWSQNNTYICIPKWMRTRDHADVEDARGRVLHLALPLEGQQIYLQQRQEMLVHSDPHPCRCRKRDFYNWTLRWAFRRALHENLPWDRFTIGSILVSAIQPYIVYSWQLPEHYPTADWSKA